MRHLECMLWMSVAAALPAQTPSILLSKSEGGTQSYFGTSACFVGDIDHDGRSEVAFGAPFASLNGPGSGMVCVYRANGTKLFTLLGANYQELGVSIAALGDVNQDGIVDFVVGSGEGLPAAKGSVSVYSGADGALLKKIDGGESGGRFGSSVAGIGDVNSDGYPDFATVLSHSGGTITIWSGKDFGLLKSLGATAPGDAVGMVVANVGDIDGDGYADLGLGVPRANTGASLGGLFRVYSGKTFAVLVEKSGSTVNAALGSALAPLGGDWDGDGRADFVVGAPGNNDGAGVDAGAALVYNGHGTLVARFQGLAGDRLGSSVAGGGDIDGDRFVDVVAGALGRYVRVYSGAAGHPVLHTINAPGVGDAFATALDLRGDLDGDGFEDLAVGAPWTDPTRSGSGSVYDFGHAWLPKLMISKLGGAGAASLGAAGCFVGDLDGDGRSEVAFAAPGIDTVRVYRADGTQVLSIVGPVLGYGHRFGRALAPAGDVNGDGVQDLVIGSSNEFMSGLVRVCSGVTGAALFTFSGDQSGDQLGISVAGVGDLNGDGYDDFAAGATQQGGAGFGYVRIWSGKTGAVLRTIVGDASNELFGFAIAGVGDIDGDGIPDVGVGAPAATRRAPQGGLVRVYSGRTFQAIAEKTGNTNNEGLGTAVAALGGDWDNDGLWDYVAGSPRNDDGSGFESGSLFVFNIYGHVLHRFDGATGDRFGAVVTGAGDVDGDGVPDVAGAALSKYVRVFSGAGEHPTLHSFSAATASDNFGSALDLRGDLDGDGFADLAIGAANGGSAGEGQAVVHDLDHVGTPPRALTRGRACATSDGRLPHVELRGRSAIGTTLGFRLRGGKATTPVALLLGTSMDLRLDPYGAPGCTAYVNPLVTVAGATDAAGYASIPGFTIPFDAALIGLRLDCQFGIPDAPANLLGVVLSTYAAFWVGL